MNDVRTPSRSVLVGAATWVGVVAVVAALVWVVITRAGAGVSDDTGLGDTGAPAPIGTSSSREPSTTPTRTPRPSASSTRADPAPEPVQRSASGVGGTLTVRCTGRAADMVAATPSGGYAAEVKDAGPDRIRVEFETERSSTEIEATCPGGSPSFSVEEDD